MTREPCAASFQHRGQLFTEPRLEVEQKLGYERSALKIKRINYVFVAKAAPKMEHCGQEDHVQLYYWATELLIEYGLHRILLLTTSPYYCQYSFTMDQPLDLLLKETPFSLTSQTQYLYFVGWCPYPTFSFCNYWFSWFCLFLLHPKNTFYFCNSQFSSH